MTTQKIKTTVATFGAMKAEGKRISMLTCYDYTTARLIEESSVNAILVGDSLGNVMLGYPDTLAVTVEDMITYGAAVVRGVKNTMVVVDMPFMSFQLDKVETMKNACELIKAGANAVKIEGSSDFIIENINHLTQNGVPVMGHLGFTPLSINTLGGHKVQGKDADRTIEILKASLPAEAALGNPIDVIGDARADRYETALKILCESGEYKNILVLLTPQMVTDPTGTAEAIVRIAPQYKNVNVFAVFVGGVKVKEGRKILDDAHILNYEYPIDIIRLLGLLKAQMAYRGAQDVSCDTKEVPQAIKEAIAKAKEEKLASLPQNVVNMIMDHYGIDYPKSGNFTDKAQAYAFCQKIFPAPVVLKLSAPDALHKTEMKGIYLNVHDEATFNEAWEGLNGSITKFQLKGASVLIQEMIVKATETIIGVNSDRNFGRIMVFGTGGIYTEVMKDTTLRILPAVDFDDMIKETKVGVILNKTVWYIILNKQNCIDFKIARHGNQALPEKDNQTRQFVVM